MPSEETWFDGHLDLACIALGRDREMPTLEKEPDPTLGAVSLRSLARGNVRACMATIFTAMEELHSNEGVPVSFCGYRDHEDRDGAHTAGMRQLELYESWEREGLLRIARTITDLDSALAGEGPPAIVLLMECADPIRTPEEVSWWVQRGLRMIGLSWGHGSRYSGGNNRAGGLTSEGREMVAAIDEAGAAHDVSHLADEALEDLLQHAHGPIASSHSNARALLPDGKYATRHLRADHALELANRGGVAGVNLYGCFLAEDRRAQISDVVAHAESLAEAFGRERVGLGSDMDGGFGPDDLPEGLEGHDRLGTLSDALESAGWSNAELTAFRTTAWRDFLAKVPAFAAPTPA
jgi:membrane dipeptidase